MAGPEYVVMASMKKNRQNTDIQVSADSEEWGSVVGLN